MMTLLAIIYLAFVSLGLPDALHGAAWPAVSSDMGVSIALAGVLTTVTSGGTILSSLLSNRFINRYGTGPVMVASVALTAAAILGCAAAPGVWVIIALCVPLGLGAGCVDAALNNFVALHYKASHMNWLHCFWGIGATAGPLIMSLYLGAEGGWRDGFRTIGMLQWALVFVLALSLPLWKKVAAKGPSAFEGAEAGAFVGNAQALRVRGAVLALLCFFCMVGFEGSAGTWMASYLVQVRGASAQSAARLGSLFFLGTTVGRMVAGVIAMKVKSAALIRVGLWIALFAAVLILLPLPLPATIAGFLLLGIGNAPLYPAMMHETPRRFGPGVSQAVMGLQVAAAYLSSTVIPPIQGALSGVWTLQVVPWSILLFVLAAMAMNELLTRRLNAAQ